MDAWRPGVFPTVSRCPRRGRRPSTFGPGEAVLHTQSRVLPPGRKREGAARPVSFDARARRSKTVAPPSKPTPGGSRWRSPSFQRFVARGAKPGTDEELVTSAVLAVRHCLERGASAWR